MKAGEWTILVSLYENQPHSVDSLGGTPEISWMLLEFKRRTNIGLTEGEMLGNLIKARKSGILKRRTESKGKNRETWPKAVVDGGYKVKVDLTIDFDAIVYMIYNAEVNGQTLLSRIEVYEYMLTNYACIYDHNYGNCDFTEARRLARTLFPELIK